MKKTTKKTVAKKKVDLSKYNAVDGKLNPLIKRSWMTALRSGKFEQTQNVLCEIDEEGNKSYCCLGVLCEVLKKKGFNVKLNIDKEKQTAEFVCNGKADEGNINSALAKRIGLGEIEDRDKQEIYSEMNDNEGKSFKQIAQYIETHE